ncbi:hypothetical protein N9L19_01515 [bacterium]|nr:hypothetical protein [bacterium]
MPSSIEIFMSKICKMLDDGLDHILNQNEHIAGLINMKLSAEVFTVQRIALFMIIVVGLGENEVAVQDEIPPTNFTSNSNMLDVF